MAASITADHSCTLAAQATLTLLSRFLSALDCQDTAHQPTIPVLNLLAKSASLVRAHTTKLSLLMLNKPFTPSAIKKVIEEMSTSALTALATGVQLTHPPVYGRIMHDEVKMRVRRIYRELEGLMQEVLVLLQAMEKEDKDHTGRDTLASTGVLWQACDALIELERMGLPGLCLQKAVQYREMLEDAIAEMKEWAEGGDGDDEQDEDDFAGSDEEDEDEFEKMMVVGASLPRNRLDLKETVEIALKKLRLTSTLYQAVIKRRLKTIPKDQPQHIAEIDLLMDSMRHIPDETDELANALYELDNEEAKKLLGKIVTLGTASTEAVQKNWMGEEDEFTIWSAKWKEAVRNPDPFSI
jgi:hypothetical protein